MEWFKKPQPPIRVNYPTPSKDILKQAESYLEEDRLKQEADEKNRKLREYENAERENAARTDAKKALKKLPSLNRWDLCPKCHEPDLTRTYVPNHQLAKFYTSNREKDHGLRWDDSSWRWTSYWSEVVVEAMRVVCSNCGYEVGFERTADKDSGLRVIHHRDEKLGSIFP